jgi:hypothetical protein
MIVPAWRADVIRKACIRLLLSDGAGLTARQCATVLGRAGHRVEGVPVALTALATLVRPGAWRSFASGSTEAYSLTPAAWEELRQAGAAVGLGAPGA